MNQKFDKSPANAYHYPSHIKAYLKKFRSANLNIR